MIYTAANHVIYKPANYVIYKVNMVLHVHRNHKAC